MLISEINSFILTHQSSFTEASVCRARILVNGTGSCHFLTFYKNQQLLNSRRAWLGRWGRKVTGSTLEVLLTESFSEL